MPQDFGDVVMIVVNLIRSVIPVIIAFAVIAFFWGMLKFMRSLSGDTKGIESGKSFMIWGLIALFVLFSVWGILGLLSTSAGFGGLRYPIIR
jgi:hypothetical protein